MTTFISTKSFQTVVKTYINDLNLYYLNNFDIINALGIDCIDSPDELKYAVDDLDAYDYFQENIIYHSTAMKFLMENDGSLKESLELAKEFDYSLSDLNSELLASLLATQYNIDEWEEIKQNIIDAFDGDEVLDTDDVLECNLDSLQLIVNKHNYQDVDWFNCVINQTEQTLTVFINQDDLDKSEVLLALPHITQQELDESEEISYVELDIDDIISQAEALTIVIKE